MTQPLPYCVYVLFSLKDGRLYISYTTDLDQRVRTHADGGVISTKFRRPFRLIYCEFHSSEIDARRRETYFKTDKGKRALRIALPDGLNLLSLLPTP